MTVSIYYHTRFGNNTQVAEMAAKCLTDTGNQVSVRRIAETDPSVIPLSDLYIIGSPTQIGTLPLRVERFIGNLTLSPGSRFAVFATHVGSSSDAAAKITKVLESRGAEPVTGPLRLAVKDVKGPLEDGWQDLVAQWCSAIPDSNPR
jgi:flavodoxin